MQHEVCKFRFLIVIQFSIYHADGPEARLIVATELASSVFLWHIPSVHFQRLLEIFCLVVKAGLRIAAAAGKLNLSSFRSGVNKSK